MQVAIVVFEGITVLDAVGPYEVLSYLPDAEVRLVSTAKAPVRNQKGSLSLFADWTLDETPRPDVIVMPGGPGEADVRKDERVLAWLRRVHETTLWTTSVCTGALTLAAAGILDGLDATTHWMSTETLAELGARPVAKRVVVGDRVITAAGVSAGIDMALCLAALLAGDDVAQAIQLVIEYDPEPPFGAGSPSKAPAHIVEMVSPGSTS
jgi:transcriptional regulator GlxA family with amidase domain